MLFDGECTLCSGIVRFVAANDPAGRFRFASLRSDAARAMLGDDAGVTAEPDTIVLLDYGRRFDRSDAALYLALGMRAPWPAAFALILVPRGVRDAVYRWIARNRFRWFPRRADVCAMPPAWLRDRLLDG